MTNNLSSRTILSTLAILVVAGAVPDVAYADNSQPLLKVDLAKSHFGPGPNTLVLKPDTAKAVAQDARANSTPAARSLLVISNGNIYLATDRTGREPSSGKSVDYSHWKDMELVQIGNYARTIRCGFFVNCQSGQADHRMTFTFMPTANMNAEEMMGNSVVLNAR